MTQVLEEKTEEELARVAEKKKEAGRRLQEQSARQRLEKLVRQEEEMTTFSELKASKGTGKKVDYEVRRAAGSTAGENGGADSVGNGRDVQKRLKAAGFSSTEDLDAYLQKLDKTLQRARNKELGIDENEGKVRPPFLLPPSFIHY